MSTIKSSAENLTLNADGANNDIKFQSNGSEVASIDQAGLLTASSLIVAGTNANLTFASSGNNITFARNSSNYISATGGSSSNLTLDGQSKIALNHNGTEKLRVTANGLTFNGDTAAANALDDYEEGNWTPSWSPTGGSWSGTGVGKYTKIGRQVTASFNWLASGQATGTKFNSVSGLPFTSLNETTRYPAIVTMNGAGASGHTLNATVSVNSTSIDLQMQPQSTGAHGEFTPAQTASGAEISATVTYFVA